jgi:hypothetical protein
VQPISAARLTTQLDRLYFVFLQGKRREDELESILTAFYGPDVALKDVTLMVTADGASSNKFDGMDWITVAVCACHRLSTAVSVSRSSIPHR